MYQTISTRCSTVCIHNSIINDVLPLIQACNAHVSKQTSADSLLCAVVDMFDDDFAEEFGTTPQEREHGIDNELISKLVVTVLNSKHYLIDDIETFCSEFNEEDLPLTIGFDKAFYPREQGHWYSQQEFAICPN
jgi:hypothetical protein